MTPVFDGYANSNENAKGVAYPAINDDRLYRAVIALPPLAEQKRIVAKIEELLPYIDRYEQAWSKLEQFNSRFPEDMKKSLLQYAIQGKLVEQRPEEGTAEELFAQIQEEKQRLIPRDFHSAPPNLRSTLPQRRCFCKNWTGKVRKKVENRPEPCYNIPLVRIILYQTLERGVL